MARKQRKHDKHAAGGPGKAPRRRHTEPEKNGNKPGQRQNGRVGLPGEGRKVGTQRREPDKVEKSG